MKPFEIVILGGGTAGWMAANLMAKQWLPEKAKITVVESPDIGIIGVGEGSTPTLKRFFNSMGITEKQWMPECKATYKMGIRFDGWSPQSGLAQYSHPFTTQIDVHTARAFHVNCQTRRLGLDVHTDPGDFFLNGLLTKQGKGPATPDSFPFIIEYGYHFDSGLLGAFLAQHAESLGVERAFHKIESAGLSESGEITHLCCDNGELIAGDFFIDCTGFSSLLLQKTLGVNFESFEKNLFNDAAVVLPTQALSSVPVQTVSTAMSNGWCWQIPLTHRVGNGYVFSSSYQNPDEAELELRQHLGLLDADIEARHLKMKVGQAEKHWQKNCLALGLSQGFIEPLEATALHLVQISIETFIREFEKGDFTSQNQQQFNADIHERFEHVRNYIVAHYKLNTRDDTDYWRDNRDNLELSDSLLMLLEVWYKREDIEQEIYRQKIGAHFPVASWNCLLAGYGAFPELAKKQPGQGDLYTEKKIAQFLQGCSLNFVEHNELLTGLLD